MKNGLLNYPSQDNLKDQYITFVELDIIQIFFLNCIRKNQNGNYNGRHAINEDSCSTPPRNGR